MQHQPYHLPGNICDTIKQTTKNKAAGLNADSTDAFIDLVNANIPKVNEDLQHIFNQIFLNNIPQPIQHYFSDVYLFCLHKDPNNPTNLRPLGIPTAIRQLMARHVAQTFKAKFAEFLLPYNFAVGIPNGGETIINAIHLSIEKFITNKEANQGTPTRAAVFFDLKNMFNSISRKEFFNVIETSFPELLPLTTLLYNDPGTVYHKWTNNTWRTLQMDEGSTQGCPLSPIFGSLVVARLLKPIDDSLRKRAAARLTAGNLLDDNHGGITNLFGYIDDISTVTPLEDLLFLCQQMDSNGQPLGCFLNTYKTRILTSTSGSSPIPQISITDPELGNSITTAISTYSNKHNITDPLHPTPVELTQGYRLLGTPVGSITFAIEYINEKLEEIQQQTDAIHLAISDPQTRYKIFMECTIQKLPHLLLTDVLYNHDPNDTSQDFNHWNGPLTTAINNIIINFLQILFNIDTLPPHSLQIAQLDVTNGGLGCWDPSARAIPDFVLNFNKTRRHAIRGITTHRNLPPQQLHQTIIDLYTIDTNPNSKILKRFYNLLPNIASTACPPTIPRTDLCDYFLTTLSPTSARSRIKKMVAHHKLYDIYETFYTTDRQSLHLLPSILSSTTSYPLVTMNRSNQAHRLSPTDFQIMARRKLRLAIYPHEVLCKCKKQHDIFGDHAFFCAKTHKGSTHNIITNKIATALPLAIVEAQISYPFTTMEIEPKLHLNADVLARPMDIAFTPNRSEHPSSTYTSIGFDITITKVPNPPPIDSSTPNDCITKNTANADSNLQDYERSKLNRNTNYKTSPTISGEAVIGNLLNNNTILIPIAIDGFGRLGPMFRATLFGTTPPQLQPRKQFKANKPNAKKMYERATTFPAPLGILRTADHHWNSNTTKPRQFFGHSHTAPTPSITVTQQIGLAITKAYGHHILKSTKNMIFSQTQPPFDFINFILPKTLVHIDEPIDVEI